MGKSRSHDEHFYPVPAKISLSKPTNIDKNPRVQKQIIRQAVKAAFVKQEPYVTDKELEEYDCSLVDKEEVELVTSIMSSLQPTNAVEAALAAQFTATYIQGMQMFTEASWTKDKEMALKMLGFGHSVLDILLKYRNNGAQQIAVQYNVNQDKVVNIKNMKVNNKKNRKKEA